MRTLGEPILCGRETPSTQEHRRISLERLPIFGCLEQPPPEVQIVAALSDPLLDRKSTRLNSSHLVISYAVFCLKKKKCSTPVEVDAESIRSTRVTTNVLIDQ